MAVALTAFAAWLVLMFIGTNLIGVVVGGFVRPSPKRFETNPVTASMASRANRAVTLSAVMSGMVCVAYLYALGHFGNLGVVAAAIMLMVSRVPDLLWEIWTGERITRSYAPTGSLAIAETGLSWSAIPVLCLP